MQLHGGGRVSRSKSYVIAQLLLQMHTKKMFDLETKVKMTEDSIRN